MSDHKRLFILSRRRWLRRLTSLFLFHHQTYDETEKERDWQQAAYSDEDDEKMFVYNQIKQQEGNSTETLVGIGLAEKPPLFTTLMDHLSLTLIRVFTERLS